MTNINCSNVSFRGETKVTPKGNKYYASNVGLLYNGGMATANTALDMIGNYRGIAGSLLGGAAYIATNCFIGSYVDKKRNKKAAAAADYIQQVGAKKALATNEQIQVADSGRLYYKSKEGAKYLTRIGAALGGALGLMLSLGVSRLTQKIDLPKMSKAAAVIVLPLLGAGGGALCGWINGLITDWLTNWDARKHA